MAAMELKAPYLLFIGNVSDPTYAKTAQGLAYWCPEKCLGQISTGSAAVNIGVPELSLSQAVAGGARTLIVGIANMGGYIEDGWIATFCEAMEAGLDIAAGLHMRLSDIPRLSETAARLGRTLHDVRVPPENLPVGTGKKRTGLRLATVGTDCALGKKWTALALQREMEARGIDATFRATGQTGIMIAGAGIPIDAVVSDFVSGAAEILSPDADAAHWDVIEGQGSLFNPGYAAVTLGLLHGSQPDAFVVCHHEGRTEIEGFPGFPVPSVAECIELVAANGRVTNPAIRCVGVSVNSSHMDDAARNAYLAALAAEVGVPCVDAIATGVGPIIDHLQKEFG